MLFSESAPFHRNKCKQNKTSRLRRHSFKHYWIAKTSLNKQTYDVTQSIKLFGFPQPASELWNGPTDLGLLYAAVQLPYSLKVPAVISKLIDENLHIAENVGLLNFCSVIKKFSCEHNGLLGVDFCVASRSKERQLNNSQWNCQCGKNALSR